MKIQVTNLSFSYSEKPFIQDMSFHVNEGEIFGFLGPSGSGKSTLQKILTGLIPSYTGSATLSGMECRTPPAGFYERIGVDFEYSTMYEKLTARQNLQFFSSLYAKQPASIEKLAQHIGLDQHLDKKVADYSKGMRSRLNFIKALLHDPDILFLDEPTSGLDPTNNQLMKEMILAEKAKGKTILLTTHNMADASELCDRIAFIVNGTIAALDSPRQLIMQKGATQVTYTYMEEAEQTVTVPLADLSKDTRFTQLVQQKQITSIHTSEPNLSDLFTEITGRHLL